MTNLSSSLITYSFWTNIASNLSARSSRGLEDKIKMDIKCVVNIGFKDVHRIHLDRNM
jgi:hypothetical protein